MGNRGIFSCDQCFAGIFLFLLIVFVTPSDGLMTTVAGRNRLSPYQISNKSDMKYLSENSSEWSKHFIQTADIVFETADFQSGGDFSNGEEGWRTIGTEASSFLGLYDGDGHTISGLFINRPTIDIQGMFGYAAPVQ